MGRTGTTWVFAFSLVRLPETLAGWRAGPLARIRAVVFKTSWPAGGWAETRSAWLIGPLDLPGLLLLFSWPPVCRQPDVVRLRTASCWGGIRRHIPAQPSRPTLDIVTKPFPHQRGLSFFDLNLMALGPHSRLELNLAPRRFWLNRWIYLNLLVDFWAVLGLT